MAKTTIYVEELLAKPITLPTFDEWNHDDTTPGGGPGIDRLILGDVGDEHYEKVGEVTEENPIPSAGIRRS